MRIGGAGFGKASDREASARGLSMPFQMGRAGYATSLREETVEKNKNQLPLADVIGLGIRGQEEPG
ncbi:hypothetical protein DAERI_060193 [Deinococcus aerius]|uniref:Uncharacterized protein n=1 Tax=Deinococcus aerius TaxID=200253 RepID=A0A2I9CVH6_9DEIO|nr:hypothetical protein DAERI_060193 [Deinococcus aerius]